MHYMAFVHRVYFTAQIITTDWEICSVLYRMFRFFKLTGSIRIRHPTMPCVLGCKTKKKVLWRPEKHCWLYVWFLLKSCGIMVIKHWNTELNKIDSDLSLLWLTANVSLYPLSLYFSFAVSYFYEKDKRVVLEYFDLLYLLFWEILNSNLTFAICRKHDSKSV